MRWMVCCHSYGKYSVFNENFWSIFVFVHANFTFIQIGSTLNILDWIWCYDLDHKSFIAWRCAPSAKWFKIYMYQTILRMDETSCTNSHETVTSNRWMLRLWFDLKMKETNVLWPMTLKWWTNCCNSKNTKIILIHKSLITRQFFFNRPTTNGCDDDINDNKIWLFHSVALFPWLVVGSWWCWWNNNIVSI